MRGANFARPSALHRAYVMIWLFIIGWLVLVAVSVSEDRLRIGSGYIFVFFQSAVFLATLISLMELFALPKKTAWAQQIREDHEARDLFQTLPHGTDGPSQPSALPAIPRHETIKPPTARGSLTSNLDSAATPTANIEGGENVDEAEPNERTPLVRSDGTGEQIRTTFATTYRRSIAALVNTARKYEEDGEPYEYEQAWSGNLPSWAWFFQFLLLGPFIIILVGQLGLLLVDATHQTGSDGSPLLLPYLIVFACTLLLFLPLTPFIHRVTHHIPVFLLVVFVATLIYNLVAFPFSGNNRYKVFFIQKIDLDTKSNEVCYTGVEEYIRSIVAELPSATGKELSCGQGVRSGLTTCCYDGSAVAPRLATDLPEGVPPEEDYANLARINVTRGERNRAQLEISAKNTKACFLKFKTPVSKFSVEGGSPWDDRFGQVPEDGLDNVKLWHRTGSEKWIINIEWKTSASRASPGEDISDSAKETHWLGNSELKQRDSGLDGTLLCQWSDANTPGTITALDEALKYSPPWVAVTKTSEGLVQGSKEFKV